MKIHLALYLVFLAAQAFGAAKTWNGQISDSICGADHSVMASDGKKVDPRDCTLMCAKSGSQFVFVSGGKVFEIANQDFVDLKKNAGQNVRLDGELDSAGKIITIAKLTAQ